MLKSRRHVPHAVCERCRRCCCCLKLRRSQRRVSRVRRFAGGRRLRRHGRRRRRRRRQRSHPAGVPAASRVVPLSAFARQRPGDHSAQPVAQPLRQRRPVVSHSLSITPFTRYNRLLKRFTDVSRTSYTKEFSCT